MKEVVKILTPPGPYDYLPEFRREEAKQMGDLILED